VIWEWASWFPDEWTLRHSRGGLSYKWLHGPECNEVYSQDCRSETGCYWNFVTASQGEGAYILPRFWFRV